MTAQAVKFSRKDEVLIHRQLVVERKFLRHVTDHFLDRFDIPHNVVATDSRRALGRLQNSAQHPDHGCFARTIRAEKPEDRSLPDGKRNVIDSRESAEAFRQPSTSIIGSVMTFSEDMKVDRLAAVTVLPCPASLHS